VSYYQFNCPHGCFEAFNVQITMNDKQILMVSSTKNPFYGIRNSSESVARQQYAMDHKVLTTSQHDIYYSNRTILMVDYSNT